VQDIQLLAYVLHRPGDQLVGLVVGVDPQETWQDEEVSVVGEDVLELRRRVDDHGHSVAEDSGVLGVQSEGPVDDVDEKLEDTECVTNLD